VRCAPPGDRHAASLSGACCWASCWPARCAVGTASCAAVLAARCAASVAATGVTRAPRSRCACLARARTPLRVRACRIICCRAASRHG
jgi:hypothetical protein